MDVTVDHNKRRQRFTEYSDRNHEYECMPLNDLTILVNAKKRNKFAWQKPYDAKLLGNYIVLHQLSKQDIPKENIIVDIMRAIDDYDDGKRRIYLTSAIDLKYICPLRECDYWMLKDAIHHIRYSGSDSGNHQEMLPESSEKNKDISDADGNIGKKEEERTLEDGTKDQSVTSESLSEPIKRNLDLCKMGFAVSREHFFDDNEYDNNEKLENLTASACAHADIRSKSSATCEHEDCPSKCDCHKLYVDALSLFEKTNDLLRRVQMRQHNLNATYEQMMDVVNKDYKGIDKRTRRTSKIEPICLHKRQSVSSKSTDHMLYPSEMDTLLSEIDLNETESRQLHVASSGRSRFYVDMGDYNTVLSND